MAAKDFENRVALITGSSRGIGLATARELAGRGATVALNGRNAERLEKARAALAGEGCDVAAVNSDVSDPESCRAMIDEIVEKFGRLDILINNAGVSMRANLDELDAETCRKVVDINLMGCIYPTLYAIPQLKKNRGSVVFISSIAGLIGLPTATLYCATKTALRGLADSLRCELAPEGAHVGIVYVGFTENDPEKTVLGAGGSPVPHDRPAHGKQSDVARATADLIRHRRNSVVLSPIGKFAAIISRVSPELVEQTIVFSRKHRISDRLNMR